MSLSGLPGDASPIQTAGVEIDLASAPQTTGDTPRRWGYATSIVALAPCTLVVLYAEGDGNARTFTLAAGAGIRGRIAKILAGTTSGVGLLVAWGEDR